jgi:tRNA pseudouridine38-40 synthase
MRDQYFCAILQYAGHGFAGWQRQASDRTVQGVLEEGLEQLVGHRVTTNAAGRTDSGVHALGQVVSFKGPRKWDPGDLQRALNAVTPADLWVAEVAPAPEGFHARKDASARRYRFVLGCDPGSASPFRRPYEWALGEPVDLEALGKAADLFVGEHDFRPLSTAGQEKPHYRCTVTQCEWQERRGQEGFIFNVEADRFLHRMVRFMVGAMVDVARKRRPLTDISAVLAATSNADASPPAPPQGLYMLGALYPHPELRRVNDFVLER